MIVNAQESPELQGAAKVQTSRCECSHPVQTGLEPWMLNHLIPTTGDSHVPQIKFLGDCTQCYGDWFCYRPGCRISLAVFRRRQQPSTRSAQPPAVPCGCPVGS